MVELHFKSSGERPKCIHVYARSKQDLRYYLRFVYKRGDEYGHQLNQLKRGYSDYAGTPLSVPKEANSLLKNLGLLDRSNTPTEYGTFLATALEEGRSDLFEDALIQHMRSFPTIAYTIDILRDEGDEMTADAVSDRLRTLSDAESTFEDNSIRNCLNLLADFDVLGYGDSVARYHSRDRTTLEAVPYAILLLAGERETVEAVALREQLPRLLHCSAEGTEEMFRKARRQFKVFTYFSRGDPDRMQPFADVFEVEVGGASPKILVTTLL